ncbi:hypothetical protein [Porticoccus sp.]|nr:hypothetical protein [Porticoccus sp.]
MLEAIQMAWIEELD